MKKHIIAYLAIAAIITVIVMLFSGCTKKPNTHTSLVTNTKNGVIVEQIISPSCDTINDVYYEYQADTRTYHADIQDFSKYWDVRYHVSNKSSACINGIMEFWAKIDLTKWHSDVKYGGPQSTLIYKFTEKYPWSIGDNLAIQFRMDEPVYNNIGGGGINVNFFIENAYTLERLNYIINVYALNSYIGEMADVMFDTTTATSWVSTNINTGNLYTTISPLSQRSNTIGDDNFYRVNITYGNLGKLVDFPEEWSVLFIGIQYELEEEMGEGIASTGFRDFSAYITKGVI